MAIAKVHTKYSAISSGSSLADDNDCVVRAFAMTLNKPYDDVYLACKNHGRRDGRGTYGHTIKAVAEENGMVPVSTKLPTKDSHGNVQFMTVSQFIKANPAGSFYVQRRGHAFAIINGVVQDWQYGTGPRSRINVAYTKA